MRAALVLATLAVAAAPPNPRLPVTTFLVQATPAKALAFAQLSPRYAKQLDRRYGPCTTAIKANPPVTHIRISNVHVAGRNATLDVHYLAGGRPLAERFVLVVLDGAWRIDGAGPI